MTAIAVPVIAAGVVGVSSAARAAVSADFGAQVQLTAHYVGAVPAATCDLTSGTANSSSTPQAVTSGTHHASSSTTATFTSSADSTDHVTLSGHISSTIVVAKSGPDLKSLSLTSTGSVTIRSALGSSSSCASSGQALGGGDLTFTEHSPGWLTVTHSANATDSLILLAIQDSTTHRAVAFDEYQGDTSHETSTTFLPAGTYDAVEAVTGIVGGDQGFFRNAGRTTQPSSHTVSLTASFAKAGSATGAASGTAKRYVAFSASLTCSSGTGALHWTTNADQASSGVFLVNGRQKATTRKPVSGLRVSVKVPTASAVTITARVMLKSGAVVTARRSYVACQGG